ncbi:MAG: fumarylacetoacetate hydrolase family protein [Hyphomicrobiales bacterium]|nr:fumarylacetoacetate hydrolase family protein [Hyphomicrobiales bacterium]
MAAPKVAARKPAAAKKTAAKSPARGAATKPKKSSASPTKAGARKSAAGKTSARKTVAGKSGAKKASKVNVKALARSLDRAAQEATPIQQISDQTPISLEQAYQIQKEAIALRMLRREQRAGIKMGFTSRAKIAQMGIGDLIWGRLTDGMIVEEGAPIDFSAYIHPRVEPEIAFLLKRPLSGRITPMQAMEAVEAIAPALEIIDSRYSNFKFSLEDVVADNASSSGFVTGPWQIPDFDFGNLGLVLSFNGKPVQIGSTAAIMGHPLRSLVAAARFAGEAGEPLKPGWIVMAGGATAAEPLAAGQYVELEMEHMGRVAFGVSA